MGEAFAFDYVKRRLFDSLLGTEPRLSNDSDAHFIIQRGGRVFAEGRWRNGSCLDSEAHEEGGQHYDFEVSMEGVIHYYEVKSTGDSASVALSEGGDQFSLTAEESAFAVQHRDKYHVVRVYDAPDDKKAMGLARGCDCLIIDDPLQIVRSGTLTIKLKRGASGGHSISVKQIGAR